MLCFLCLAGVAQWQSVGFPSRSRGFDSHHPLQFFPADSRLKRLPHSKRQSAKEGFMVHDGGLPEAEYKKIVPGNKKKRVLQKKTQRIISSLVVLVCVAFLILGGASLVSANVHAYIVNVDGREVAALVSKSEADQAIDQCLNNIATEMNSQLTLTYSNNIKIEQISASGVVFSSVNDAANLLKDQLDIVADATVVKINGKDSLYVADENVAIEAVNAAKNYYGDPKEDPTIQRVFTSEKISMDSVKIPLEDVLTKEEATSMLLFGSTKIQTEPKPMVHINVERTNVVTEVLPYQVIKKDNTSLARGEEKVITEGVDGVQEVTYSVTEVNGVMRGSKNISSQVIVPAVDKVVEIGTYYYIASRSDGGGSGAFGWPCNGTITSRFGWRSRGWHSGVDIASPIGTTLFAAESGTVIATNNESGYGLVVRIDHGGGFVTVYAHCREFYVSVGDKVDRNTPVAAIGMTGTTTGPHVHFEVRVDGTAVNPLDYLE